MAACQWMLLGALVVLLGEFLLTSTLAMYRRSPKPVYAMVRVTFPPEVIWFDDADMVQVGSAGSFTVMVTSQVLDPPGPSTRPR